MTAPSPSLVVQVEFAADAAESVLHVVEAALPGDGRPRAAVETARAWARGEVTDEQVRDAERAARAAAHELTVPGIATPASAAARAAAAAAGTARNISECTRAIGHAAAARSLPPAGPAFVVRRHEPDGTVRALTAHPTAAEAQARADRFARRDDVRTYRVVDFTGT